jgi:hypothetical protein
MNDYGKIIEQEVICLREVCPLRLKCITDDRSIVWLTRPCVKTWYRKMNYINYEKYENDEI